MKNFSKKQLKKVGVKNGFFFGKGHLYLELKDGTRKIILNVGSVA